MFGIKWLSSCAVMITLAASTQKHTHKQTQIRIFPAP